MSLADLVTDLGRVRVSGRAVRGAEERGPVKASSWRRVTVVAALALADALAGSGAALLAAGLLRFAGHPGADLGADALVAPAALLVCLHTLLGLYGPGRFSPVELFRLRVLAAFVFALFLAELSCRGSGIVARLIDLAVLAPAVMLLGSLASVAIRRLLTRLDIWQTRVVLVGELAPVRDLSRVIEATPDLGMTVVARVAPGDPRLSNPEPLACGAADLAVLLSCGDGQEDARIAAGLRFPSVVIVRDAGDMQTLWLGLRAIGGALGIEIRRPFAAGSLVMKRILDLSAGLALLVGTLPLVALGALAVWFVDRGNPFYAQTRIGRDGRTFRVWKIRSMFRDAEARLETHLAADPGARAEWARSFKLVDDPRILPVVGHAIRRSSLDELPQFWNVVRGEMSLVGPRPFPAYHLAGFDEPFRRLRASVTPGLTGLWQITSRSDGDLQVQKRADTFYVRNWSIWFDLYILLHTLPAVVFGKGAR